MKQIGVIGAGTWALALTRMLSNTGHDVTVWSAVPEEIDELEKTRHQKNLPYMEIPGQVKFTKDVELVCKDKDILLFAVPSVYVRQTAKTVSPYVKTGQIIVDVAKGIEDKTLLFLSQVIEAEIPNSKVVALSGPTHAEEVAKDLPSSIIAAYKDLKVAQFVQEVFSNPVLHVYVWDDEHGVELCGALKNIIALAAGIALGLGFGDNAKAAIITLGMAEIKKLGLKMGCKNETFSGLAGIGDLIVTATSIHSRNNRYGFLIGKGHSPVNAIKEVGMVVEGINVLPVALELAEKYSVQVPIIQLVNSIINLEINPEKAIREII